MKQKTVLSEHRKGEIALAMLIEDVRGRQTTLKRTDILKNIGVVSKDLEPFGITKDEVITMYRDIIAIVLGDIFGQQVSWSRLEAMVHQKSLSQARRCEIALCFGKADIKNKTLSLNKNEVMRKMGNVVQALKPYDIHEEEIMALYQEVVTEALENIFEQKITWETK
ncbi:MAG: hypothetical protein ACOYL8_02395 [Patescibacteria group bacterium]